MKQKKNSSGRKRNRVWLYRILILVFGMGFLVSLTIILANTYKQHKAEKIYENMRAAEPNTPEKETPKLTPKTAVETETEKEDILGQMGIEIPPKDIDFAALKEENPDIYAWIYVPGTKVDYPVLQHPTEDTFYLDRNVDKSEGLPGCIYTETVNTKDFTDPNTVLYGHNMKDKTMFGSLHDFEDKAVFDENKYIFVYTEQKTFVYQIFGAYEYNAIHLIYNFDLSISEIFQNYLDQIFEIRDMSANFRQDIRPTAENHIITLSTCVAGEKNKRFLVQGVLLNED